jgi:HK97 family phage major capsid protein
MNELETLKAEIAELTRVMTENAKQDRGAEVKELSEKLTALQKEVGDRKIRFADASKTAVTGISKEAERKLDEIFIASALLTRKDGRMDVDAITALKDAPDYRDAVKDAGLTQGTGSSQNTGDAVGGDFIPVGFSSTLLEEIWLKLEVANLFKRFNMTASTYTFPFAPDRLTARKVAEAAAPTKDRFATDQIIFTAKKIMANVDFTDEIEQDSIIAILPLVRQKLIESFATGQEQIAVNGDTTVGAANVNGTLAGNTEDVRLTVNGLRKLALASHSFSLASGGFSADNLRLLRTKMGKYGKNPSDLCYVVSMQDYNKMLGFANYQTLYQYGPNAVIMTGELGRIDGIPIVVTELLAASDGTTQTGYDTTGIVNATAASNVKNVCMLVNKSAYMWGDRKSFGLETFRNPYNQMTSLIGSQRLDFQKVLASADPTCVVGINY